MKAGSQVGAQEAFASPKTAEVFAPKSLIIVAFVHVLAALSFFSISTYHVAALVGVHLFFATFGIAMGYHRLYAHRSFRARPWFEKALGVIATLCFQGSPTFWAAGHRIHHILNEQYGDPYSAKRGFFWSHIRWMFFSNPNGFNYVKARRIVADLRRDEFLVWLERHATTLNVFFLIALFLICWVAGDIGLFFWIGPLRIVTIWHCVWFTNSYSHYAPVFGTKTGTAIRNSMIMSLLIGGEGDHAYHHEFPSSVRHSARSFNHDHTYWLLKLFKKIGLVRFKDPS